MVGHNVAVIVFQIGQGLPQPCLGIPVCRNRRVRDSVGHGKPLQCFIGNIAQGNIPPGKKLQQIPGVGEELLGSSDSKAVIRRSQKIRQCRKACSCIALGLPHLHAAAALCKRIGICPGGGRRFCLQFRYRKGERIGLLHQHFHRLLTAAGAHGFRRISRPDGTGIQSAHRRLDALTALSVEHTPAVLVQHMTVAVGRGGDIGVLLLRGILGDIESRIDPPPQLR